MTILGLNPEDSHIGSLDSPATGSLWAAIFSFKGRADRGEFWLISSALFVLGIIGGLLVRVVASSAFGFARALSIPFLVVFYIALSWVAIATQVRRWHDLNKSGWMTLLSFTVGNITVLLDLRWLSLPDNGDLLLFMLMTNVPNIILAIFLAFVGGTDGENRFST
jgi:uncharacterized membrane protein YhaH (DUF805 family)